MNKGDFFNVYLNGVMMTVCVLGFYNEEYSGEEMAIIALVSQDNMVHVPLEDLEVLFPRNRVIN
ncbi:MAG: hypothetical protein ACOX6E_06900 [Syntrophomonadaceae bacterium]